MRDLAPDIVRQRILIEGHFTIDVDEEVIRSFFDDLIRRLELRTYETPIVFAPGGDGRAENAGYDAFVPLIDSGISLYVWSGPKFLSVVAFTCTHFDTDAAVATTREFFAMTEVEHLSF
jgi:hypothetical protein